MEPIVILIPWAVVLVLFLLAIAVTTFLVAFVLRTRARRQEEEAVPEGELPGAEPMGERDVWDVEQG